MQPEVHVNVHPVAESGMAALLHSRGMHLVEVAGPVAERPFTPSMRLAAEILRQSFEDLDATMDAHGHLPSSARTAITRAGIERRIAELRANAAAWFADTESEHPHGLASVCELLGFDMRNICRASADPERRRVINDRLRHEWNEGGRKA